MIVKMHHLDLVCLASAREEALTSLRKLGVVHLDLSAAKGGEVVAAKGEAAEAERAVNLILKARKEYPDEERRPRSVREVLALEADRATLLAAADELTRLVRQYAPYGDFDPELAARLLATVPELRETVTLPETLPPMRLARLREKLERVEHRIALDNARLAGCDEAFILKGFPGLADAIAFAAARETMAAQGALATLSGWLPETGLKALAEAARANGWGTLVREPAPAEVPPTLIEPPRIFRPMKALFAGLGIVPAYVEADVSVPFMCYFALFFAMLVGDGAYGAIFLLATLALKRKLPRDWFVLMTVFSGATVLWGLLSNTWFGAGFPFARDWPTVTWLADPSYQHMMFLCFTIGVSHLMLARIWNGLCTLNDTTCIAQFGWAGVLLGMYLVTNVIVGIFPAFPTWGYVAFGASIVAVFCFSVKPSELKTRGAELGMLPLNIMSALGDIISYVRLFAVGLASMKVAENFNMMATDLVAGADSFWMKAVMSFAMVVILVLGHGLNLVMAALSILVHAVRLNTLEFSNHKGVTWAGYAYSPFKKRASA